MIRYFAGIITFFVVLIAASALSEVVTAELAAHGYSARRADVWGNVIVLGGFFVGAMLLYFIWP